MSMPTHTRHVVAQLESMENLRHHITWSENEYLEDDDPNPVLFSQEQQHQERQMALWVQSRGGTEVHNVKKIRIDFVLGWLGLSGFGLACCSSAVTAAVTGGCLIEGTAEALRDLETSKDPLKDLSSVSELLQAA